jgi:DNA-binding LacI/PurR family transcriptional regulator
MKGKIDGIICAEYSLMPAILEASGITNSGIGDRIKICCVDGPEGIAFTHMKQNEKDMADKIVRLLLSQINGTSTETDFKVPAILMDRKK